MCHGSSCSEPSCCSSLSLAVLLLLPSPPPPPPPPVRPRPLLPLHSHLLLVRLGGACTVTLASCISPLPPPPPAEREEDDGQEEEEEEDGARSHKKRRESCPTVGGNAASWRDGTRPVATVGQDGRGRTDERRGEWVRRKIVKRETADNGDDDFELGRKEGRRPFSPCKKKEGRKADAAADAARAG
jgi:hypothetical protein